MSYGLPDADYQLDANGNRRQWRPIAMSTTRCRSAIRPSTRACSTTRPTHRTTPGVVHPTELGAMAAAAIQDPTLNLYSASFANTEWARIATGGRTTASRISSRGAVRSAIWTRSSPIGAARAGIRFGGSFRTRWPHRVDTYVRSRQRAARETAELSRRTDSVEPYTLAAETAGGSCRPRRFGNGGAVLALYAAHGVDYIFINPGTDTFPLQEAYARRTEQGLACPQAVMCIHEHVAVSAAHGYFLAIAPPAGGAGPRRPGDDQRRRRPAQRPAGQRGHRLHRRARTVCLDPRRARRDGLRHFLLPGAARPGWHRAQLHQVAVRAHAT